jgi:PrtD family type I secretion system ABC transporter
MAHPAPTEGWLGYLRVPLRTVLGFSLVINLALLAPSLFMLQVFDRVLTTQSLETLAMMALVAVSALVLMGVLDFYRARSLAAIGIRLEQQEGPALLSRLLATACRQGPRSVSDGMRDLAVLRGFLSGPGVVALFDAPWAVFYVLLIYLFHPALGLAATLSVLALAGLALASQRRTAKTIGELGEQARKAARVVDASLRHAETVNALGMQPAIAGRWQRMTDGTHRLQLELSRHGGHLATASKITRQLVQVLMLGYGAYLVIQDHATPGIMLATTIILARAMAPLEMLVAQWKTLVEARDAHARLRALASRAEDTAATTQLPRPSGPLLVENLGYVVASTERALLHDVSFQAHPGQVVAVVGPSGSGKTTLARLLVGSLQPSSGVVRLDGSDLRAWDASRLGAWLGYVPQDAALFDGSVAENIARLGAIDSDAVLSAAREAHVHELLQRLPAGYDTPVGESGGLLSGGQRQRVALARALYGRPSFIVMDEPDASLDAEGEQALIETLKQLKAREAVVVVVTQRRAVLSVADRVLVMRDGTIERFAAVETAARGGAVSTQG